MDMGASNAYASTDRVAGVAAGAVVASVAFVSASRSTATERPISRTVFA